MATQFKPKSHKLYAWGEEESFNIFYFYAPNPQRDGGHLLTINAEEDPALVKLEQVQGNPFGMASDPHEGVENADAIKLTSGAIIYLKEIETSTFFCDVYGALMRALCHANIPKNHPTIRKFLNIAKKGW